MKPKIFFSSPCHTGMVPLQYAAGLEEFRDALSRAGMDYHMMAHQVIGESLITRARNVEIQRFLCTDCTHMFCWDSDQRMTPSQGLVELVKLDLPFVGVPVALKFKTDWNRVIAAAKRGESPERVSKSGKRFNIEMLSTDQRMENSLLEVSKIGTGCLLLKREVLEQMIDHYADEWFFTGTPSGAERPVPRLFDHTVNSDRVYLSEDFEFCEKWKKLGGKVYAWCGVDITHMGQHDFGGDFAIFLEEWERNAV